MIRETPVPSLSSVIVESGRTARDRDKRSCSLLQSISSSVRNPSGPALVLVGIPKGMFGWFGRFLENFAKTIHLCSRSREWPGWESASAKLHVFVCTAVTTHTLIPP